MLYFDTRDMAREFARKKPQYKALDLANSGKDKRWGVLVLANVDKPKGAKAA